MKPEVPPPEDRSMQKKTWKNEILTIPNILSMFRLALIPVYVVIYLNAKEAADYFLAGGILAVSCLTDMVDGKIARKFNMISTFGQILDPIADKATQFTLIICIAIRKPVLLYLVALFVVKEGFQLIAALVNLKHHKILPGALMAGKVCTTVLFISLIIMVLMPELSELAVNVIVVIDAAFMIVSFISYILAYFGKDKKVQDM